MMQNIEEMERAYQAIPAPHPTASEYQYIC